MNSYRVESTISKKRWDQLTWKQQIQDFKKWKTEKHKVKNRTKHYNTEENRVWRILQKKKK